MSPKKINLRLVYDCFNVFYLLIMKTRYTVKEDETSN